MPQTLREAFSNNGMRAEFRGNAAMILPVTRELLDDIGADALAGQVGQTISAGQLLASWNEDGRRRGMALNPNAGNDIVLMVQRNDGGETRVPASNLGHAAVRLIEMQRDSVREHEAVAEVNAKNQEDYRAAIARGEHVDEPETIEPTYAETAFARFPALVECVESGIDATIADRFADIAAKSQAFAARHELGRANSNVLTPEEMGRVAEARALREQIGALQPDHADALTPAEGPYEGDSEAARELMESLDVPGQGFSAAQMSAIAANPVVSKEVFAVLTTTPAIQLSAKMLSREGHEAALQELGRHEERNWAPEALDRVSQVLADRIPGYEFEARLFTKDDADVLLVRDHVGAYLYSWDSASRVAEVNVQDRILSTYGREDVPSEDDLHNLRVTLQDLSYDNGAEIDFSFDEEDPDIVEDDNPFDIDRGPRPYDEA